MGGGGGRGTEAGTSRSTGHTRASLSHSSCNQIPMAAPTCMPSPSAIPVSADADHALPSQPGVVYSEHQLPGGSCLLQHILLSVEKQCNAIPRAHPSKSSRVALYLAGAQLSALASPSLRVTHRGSCPLPCLSLRVPVSVLLFLWIPTGLFLCTLQSSASWDSSPSIPSYTATR